MRTHWKTLVFLACMAGVPAGRAQINAPVVVDLQNMDNKSRLGISLNIGGASVDEVYLFDSGSSPLTSAWADGAPWWGTYTVDTNVTKDIKYGGGNGTQKFDYYPAKSSISIVGSPISSPSTSDIAMIFGGYTNNDPHGAPNWVPDTQFNQAIVDAVTTNVAPFPSHVFGTLGADLRDPQHGFMHLVDSQTYGPSITKGFLIDATADQPTLTIGLDQPTLDSFTNVYAMNITGGVVDQLLISPEYDLIFEGTSHTLGAIPTLLDTGTPPDSRLFITQGSSVDVSAYTRDGFLKDGVTITMLLNGDPYTITSSASQKISVFGSPTDSATGGLTYGLNFFRDHQVLYNLDSKQVGIRSVPEPTAALFAVFGGALLGMFRLGRARFRASKS